MYERIPQEMRACAQWVVWRLEENGGDKPTKVPYNPNDGHKASVNNPASWSTFDDAVLVAKRDWYSGIGFVLTANDPYAFIDLDDTHGDATAAARQEFIYNNFVSYAERSPSKKGLHIIVKGAIPSGRKRSFVECYSSGRFMTMTGDVYRAEPISEYNDLLNTLWSEMGGKSDSVVIYDGNAPQTEEDNAILQRACNAANGAKFQALLFGHWNNYYPSQSEADFAFVDMLAFYTQNREQIARIFNGSPLGARNKQTTIRGVGYVDYMINKSFDRLLPPVNLDGLRNQVDEAIARMNAAQQIYTVPDTTIYSASPDTPPADEPKSENPVYSVPPGLVGELARFIYGQAQRQVPEIALVGAIGLMAGICGRAFNVSGTGLNQYVLLLAKTGAGKEAIASGIDKIMSAVQRSVPNAWEFVGPGEIASPQALTKYMAKRAKSFISLTGEFGLYMQQMSAFNAPPHLVGLRRMYLDLYNKSGEGKVLRPSIYSDIDKNTEAVLSPAFSMIGESTATEFYKALNESMISSGLLPRFTIIEYNGPAQELNEGHTKVQPSESLVHSMAALCAHCLMLNNANKSVHVAFDEDSERMFKMFDKHCVSKLNKHEDNVISNLWNRAHIKAMKLAATIAVGVNPYNPIITSEIATWATNLVVSDVKNISARFERGEIGIETAESKQISDMKKTFKEYVTSGWDDLAGYKIGNAKLHDSRVIPHSFIIKRLSAQSAFRNDRVGATSAIKRTLETLIHNGDIVRLLQKEVQEKFGFGGQCYAIQNVDGIFD